MELCRLPLDLVRVEAAGALARAVSDAWGGGWQPSELVRQVRRTASAAAGQLVRAAIAADHAGRDAATIDPRWQEQIDALALPSVGATADGQWLGAWSAAAGLGVFAEIDGVIELLDVLGRLPALEVLIPPPGGTARSVSRPVGPVAPPASDAERALLGKIRALLAKAESTTFEAEAESLTAKAQELMTRHAIDTAMLAGGDPAAGDAPIAIRIPVDDPYADAKSLLLHVVATAGRCRAVYFADVAITTVIGFRAEVAGVELVYTSLLVQAQTSLTHAAAAMPAGSRSRSRAFRSSFLLAYATRIGERLRTIGAEVVADAEATSGRSVLPALLRRELAVDEAVEQRYGRLTSRRIRGGHDPAGWVSGTRAADDAEFVSGALPR